MTYVSRPSWVCHGKPERTICGKLPGIVAEDIGKCAYGIFRRGPEVAGQRFGIAGEVLSGPEYAAAFSRHLGVPVSFYDMPVDDYRALGFPGADDMGNMYEHHAILGEEFRRHRSEKWPALNPALPVSRPERESSRVVRRRPPPHAPRL